MISLRLDENLEKELNILANKQNISKSKIVKDALIQYFDMLKKDTKQKLSYELGKDLFGKFASGNSDLSITYKQKLKEKIKNIVSIDSDFDIYRTLKSRV